MCPRLLSQEGAGPQIGPEGDRNQPRITQKWGRDRNQVHTEGFRLKAETGALLCPRRLRAGPPHLHPTKPQSLDGARMVLGSLDSTSLWAGSRL